MSDTATQASATAGDQTHEEALEARLTWLAGAGTEEDVHVIERALLAETDNGAHPGDPGHPGTSDPSDPSDPAGTEEPS